MIEPKVPYREPDLKAGENGTFHFYFSELVQWNGFTRHAFKIRINTDKVQWYNDGDKRWYNYNIIIDKQLTEFFESIDEILLND